MLVTVRSLMSKNSEPRFWMTRNREIRQRFHRTRQLRGICRQDVVLYNCRHANYNSYKTLNSQNTDGNKKDLYRIHKIYKRGYGARWLPALGRTYFEGCFVLPGM